MKISVEDGVVVCSLEDKDDVFLSRTTLSSSKSNINTLSNDIFIYFTP